MSKFDCPKCGKTMTLSHEERGKPQYRCKPCQDKFFAGFTPFTPSVISDAHMRRIHQSCLNPPSEIKKLREALEVMRDELLNADANVLDNDQINYVLGIVDSYIPALAPKGATE